MVNEKIVLAFLDSKLEESEFLEAIEVAKALPENKQKACFEKVFQRCLRTGDLDLVNKIAVILKRSVSLKEKEIMISKLLELGDEENSFYFNGALQLIETLPLELKNKRLEDLLDACLIEGETEISQKIARLLERSLTLDEIEKIIAASEGSDLWIARAINLLPEPQRFKRLEILLIKNIRSGESRTVREIVTFLNEPLYHKFLSKEDK